MVFIEQDGLAFDDVLIVPRRSKIGSRFNDNIDLSSEILPGIRLKYPIISANMDTVTEDSMANALSDLGALGIIHRFQRHQDHADMLNKVTGFKILCIGAGDEGIKRFNAVTSVVKIDAVLIDIAHGHSDNVIKAIEVVKSISSVPIIAGNVATKDGVYDLFEAGALCVKVGVGPGCLCTTRKVTGCGVPQLTAIVWAMEARDEYAKRTGNFASIIADGGIRDSGDIVKALGVGADAVMVGGLFAGTDEAPGNLMQMMMSHGDVHYMKQYRGMASLKAQESWKGYAASVEGESTYVPYKGSVKGVLERLVGGVLSGMSYQNALSLGELRSNSRFIRITPAGLQESGPHGK